MGRGLIGVNDMHSLRICTCAHEISSPDAFEERNRFPLETIRCSQAADLATSLVATGFPYDKSTSPDNNITQFAAVTPHVRGIRRAGSAASIWRSRRPRQARSAATARS